jgi:hypothetical protein
MEDLAIRSMVSRWTIHRLEHGAPNRTDPDSVVRVLAVVGITPTEVQELCHRVMAQVPHDAVCAGE